MSTTAALRAVRNRWWVIVLVAAVGALLGALPNPSSVSERSQATRFRATHTLILSNPDTGFDASISPVQISLFATNGEVPARVAAKLGYQGTPAGLASQVTVTYDGENGALTFTTVQSTADAAVSVADAFADETNSYLAERQEVLYQTRLAASLDRLDKLEAQLNDLQTKVASNPNDSVLIAQRDAVSRQYSVAFEQNEGLAAAPTFLTFTTLQSAQAVPIVEEGLNAPRSRVVRGVLGLIVGGAIGVGVAILLGRIDRKIRTREQAEEIMGMRVRLVIPQVKNDRRYPLVVVNGSHDVLSNAYRTLRNVIGFMQASQESRSHGLVTVVVSPGPGEGKTSLTLNLSAAFAETGQRTVAVNADFRRPQLAAWLTIPPQAQLPFILEDLEWLPPDRLLQDTKVPNLSMLDLTGLGNAGELARASAHLVPKLAAEAEALVVDTSPVGATAEVLELLPLADLIVVVVRAGRTTIEAAERTAEILREISGAHLLLVLTGVKQDRTNYYHYAYSDQGPSRAKPRTEKASRKADPRTRRYTDRLDFGPPKNGTAAPRSNGVHPGSEAGLGDERDDPFSARE